VPAAAVCSHRRSDRDTTARGAVARRGERMHARGAVGTPWLTHLVGHRGERTLDVDHGHMPDRFEEDR